MPLPCSLVRFWFCWNRIALVSGHWFYFSKSPDSRAKGVPTALRCEQVSDTIVLQFYASILAYQFPKMRWPTNNKRVAVAGFFRRSNLVWTKPGQLSTRIPQHLENLSQRPQPAQVLPLELLRSKSLPGNPQSWVGNHLCMSRLHGLQILSRFKFSNG